MDFDNTFGSMTGPVRSPTVVSYRNFYCCFEPEVTYRVCQVNGCKCDRPWRRNSLLLKARQVSSLVSLNRLLDARSFSPLLISTLYFHDIRFIRVRVAPKPRTGQTGVRISGGDFLISKHVQTGPGSHPASTSEVKGVLTRE